MKGKRLDYLEFYDAELDMIQCLVCKKWYQRLDSRHLRKHGFTNREYKSNFGILPGTPLVNKKILSAYSQNAIRLREEGVFNVYKPGDKNNPIVNRRKFRDYDNQEYRLIMSRTIVRKNPEKVRILSKISFHKSRIKELRKLLEAKNERE